MICQGCYLLYLMHCLYGMTFCACIIQFELEIESASLKHPKKISYQIVQMTRLKFLLRFDVDDFSTIIVLTVL